MNQHASFMRQAIRLAEENIQQNGGPFGAVIVKNGQIISTGLNKVTETKDPTAHAEIVAIRAACLKLNSFSLTDCTMYASCEPCPMCLAAIFWARMSALYFGATHEDAGEAGFSDALLYKELSRPFYERSIKTRQILQQEAQSPFSLWEEYEFKTLY